MKKMSKADKMFINVIEVHQGLKNDALINLNHVEVIYVDACRIRLITGRVFSVTRKSMDSIKVGLGWLDE